MVELARKEAESEAVLIRAKSEEDAKSSSAMAERAALAASQAETATTAKVSTEQENRAPAMAKQLADEQVKAAEDARIRR